MSSDKQQWFARWADGRTGFHRDEVHPDLIAYAERWLGGAPRRVLVPLCGKTFDLAWLAARGHEVVGVELVEDAVAQLHAEQGIEAEVTREHDGVTVYRSPGLTVIAGDFFALSAARVGPIECIWDRAALVALPPALRADYVAQLRRLAGTGWCLLQNAFEYDQTRGDGPPWSVPDDELRAHYGDCNIELLHRRDVIDQQPRFRDAGHTYWIASTYLIRG